MKDLIQIKAATLWQDKDPLRDTWRHEDKKQLKKTIEVFRHLQSMWAQHDRIWKVPQN